MAIFGMATDSRAGQIRCRRFGRKRFGEIEQEIGGVMPRYEEWAGGLYASGNIKSNTTLRSA
jgi:hypothetical protein